MLVIKNKFDKSKSKYQCDRCKVDLDPMQRNAIYVMEGYNAQKKKWDLCR